MRVAVFGFVTWACSCAPAPAAVTCDVDADCGDRVCVEGICVDGDPPPPPPDAGDPEPDAGLPPPGDAGPPPPGDAGPPPPEDAGPPNPNLLPGYAFRAPITITKTLAAPLANFPVPVTARVADGGAAAELAQAPVVRFTAADGLTPLAHELEVDADGGRVFWIRVPTLDATTTIYAYWDNFGGDEVAPDDPFPSAQYLAVWHLTEATAGYPDSSGRFNTARTVLITERPARAQDGVVGGAVRFDDAAPTPIHAPAVPLFELPAESFSYSLWVRVDENVGEFDMPLYCGGEPNVAGYNIELGINDWNAGLSTGDGVNARYPSLAAQGDIGELHHLAVVVDRFGREMLTYFDGALADAQTLDIADVAATGPLTIGRGDAFPYSGVVDEVRLYDGEVEAEWFAAEHEIYSDPDAVALGARESL
jgi:hypothetical protein